MANGKSISKVYTTAAFRLSFPNLFEPKPDMNGRMKYGCTMMFPKAELVAKMKADGHKVAPYLSADNGKGFYNEIVQVARQNFGPERDLRSLKIVRFTDGDAPKPKSGKVVETDKGFILIKASSKDEIDVRRQDRVRLDKTQANEVYGGCWCRAVISIGAYFNKPEDGVTLYLNGIQKICDDTAFSGRPRMDDMFDDISSGLDLPAVAMPGIPASVPETHVAPVAAQVVITPTAKMPWEM